VTRAFLDTNVLLYLLSADPKKATRAETVVADGGHVSVQVLNELVSVTRRKLLLDWNAIDEIISVVSGLLQVEPLTPSCHGLARSIARRYGFNVYDACIVASAMLAECAVLYSEDLQHGQLIEGVLRVENPFRKLSTRPAT
jgi:predicted nucleic acid-binding protein